MDQNNKNPPIKLNSSNRNQSQANSTSTTNTQKPTDKERNNDTKHCRTKIPISKNVLKSCNSKLDNSR